MSKSKALDAFFNSFGLPAYPSTRVPDDVAFPYMTYEPTLANNGNSARPRITIWFFGNSEKPINDKADEIAKAIGIGFPIRSDDGSIYAYFGEPWQAISDEADVRISGRTTNLLLTFNTK